MVEVHCITASLQGCRAVEELCEDTMPRAYVFGGRMYRSAWIISVGLSSFSFDGELSVIDL